MKKARINSTDSSPFDELAPEYDAWFDKDGSLIFFIEVQNVEVPREGYFPDAGFTIIVAGKRPAIEGKQQDYR